ncbi:unnamed protein product, partial [Aphanomyces euteiches]
LTRYSSILAAAILYPMGLLFPQWLNTPHHPIRFDHTGSSTLALPARVLLTLSILPPTNLAL